MFMGGPPLYHRGPTSQGPRQLLHGIMGDYESDFSLNRKEQRRDEPGTGYCRMSLAEKK